MIGFSFAHYLPHIFYPLCAFSIVLISHRMNLESVMLNMTENPNHILLVRNYDYRVILSFNKFMWWCAVETVFLILNHKCWEWLASCLCGYVPVLFNENLFSFASFAGFFTLWPSMLKRAVQKVYRLEQYAFVYCLMLPCKGQVSLYMWNYGSAKLPKNQRK